MLRFDQLAAAARKNQHPCDALLLGAHAGRQKSLGRMSYLREGSDRIRQVLEDSTDSGKTWTKTYAGLYTRRK